MPMRRSPLVASRTAMLSATRLTAAPPCGVRVTVLFAATGSNPVPVMWTLMPADAPSGATALNATAARIGASRAQSARRPMRQAGRGPRAHAASWDAATFVPLPGLSRVSGSLFSRVVRFRGGVGGASDRESRVPVPRSTRLPGSGTGFGGVVGGSSPGSSRTAKPGAVEAHAERSGFAEEIEEDGRHCR